MFRTMAEYYNLFAKHKVEQFSSNYQTEKPTAMSYSLDPAKSLLKNYTDDKVAEDTKVSNPYGYGYIASLPEARNQDAIAIQQQEGTLFAVGAVTGVSLIVFGILIARTP